MNLTNATGGDLIGAASQSLAPISQNILGTSNGTNFLAGLFLLLLLAGFMYSRRASMELIAVVLYFGIWGLIEVGLLPGILILPLIMITAVIVLMAFLKWVRR